MPEVVLTAVGPDRPGLVDELTGRLLEAGANIADARMVNLRGQFAMLVLLEWSQQPTAEQLRNMQQAGEKMGLVVTLARQDREAAAPRPGIPFRLRAHVMDQPGIVHRITHLLHHFGVNIEELQTRLEPGSYTGTPLFSMELRMTVPPEVQVKALRRELENLCDSLNCDVDLEACE